MYLINISNEAMSETSADLLPFSNIMIKVLEGLKTSAFNHTSEFYQTVLFDNCNGTQLTST